MDFPGTLLALTLILAVAGLIFANVGLGLAIGGQPVIDASTFSAVVMVVVATTLVSPPLLTWGLGHQRQVLTEGRLPR